jgi:Flp pilus assembly protein TadG
MKRRLLRRLAAPVGALAGDRRGAAAIEFAVIVPLMLMIFFGVVEVSTGVAVDRKVSIVARTLSDLTSQASSVTTSDLTGIFNAASSILAPYYSVNNYKAKISEIKVNSTGVATIAWGAATSNDVARTAGSPATGLPSGLAVANTYLIWSEVSYTYQPPAWHTLLGGAAQPTFTLSDSFYTRPRQSTCVLLNTTGGSCP